MNPTLSIIIPVYNGISNGLDVCLKHIWSQPLDNTLYEVICIDDCSTDNTYDWLLEQEKAHSNLRVLRNEKNLRQGGSRNVGFRNAKGIYIALVDQDDYYHDGALKSVYDHLQGNDLDVLVVDCAYQSPGKVSNTLQHNFPHREVMTGDEMIVRNSIPYAPWKFVMRRDFILDNKLFFEENERIEDVDWVHIMMHHAQKTQYQPILFVHYNKTPFSTTMTSYKTPVTTYSTLRLSQRLRNCIDSTFANSNESVKNCIRALRTRFFYLGLRNYFFINDKAADKANHIRETVLNDPIDTFNGSLTKFAIRHPLAFSHATNALAPIARLLMRAYRHIKYS